MKFSQKRLPIAAMAKGTAVVAASFVLAFSHAPMAPAQTSFIYISDAGKARWNSVDKIEACDIKLDGNQVRAHVTPYIGSSSISYTAWAPSGGCTTPLSYTQTWQYFRVCAENIGCSAWAHR